jgi:hypothetical protein
MIYGNIETKLTLHVFYVDFGVYRTALTAAQELAQAQSGMEIKAWDVFSMTSEELNAHQIRAYPTLRLFRYGQFMGDTTSAFWDKSSLARWMGKLLGE